ncbi:MAG: AAA family ATPase [Candidatus Hodarchaeales archaeon]
MSQKSKELVPLVDKYKPKSLDEVVGRDEIIKLLRIFLKQGSVPNLMFHGVQGTGKTLIADLFLKEYQGGNKRGAHLIVDASTDNKVNNVRENIVTFMSTASPISGKKKYLVLDEMDNLSDAAQVTLRRPIEKYKKSTRVIMMCNYIDKVILPLQSRCTMIRFGAIPKKAMYKFVERILREEKIPIDGKLDDYFDDIYKYGRGEIRFTLNNYLEVARATGKLDQTVIDFCNYVNSTYARLLFTGQIEQAISRAYQDPRGSITGAITYVLESKELQLSYPSRVKLLDWFYDALRDLTSGIPFHSVILRLSHKVNVKLYYKNSKSKKELSKATTKKRYNQNPKPKTIPKIKR